jgi:hypothetical protein
MKKFILITLIAAILMMPVKTYAISFDFVGKIKQVAGYIKNIKNVAHGNDLGEDVPHTFVFGGKITHSERSGCEIRVKFCPAGICWIGVSVIRIPLGGVTIEVGPPVESPEEEEEEEEDEDEDEDEGQMFTFPGISDVYANYNEDQEDVWTLGLGFTPFPIDKINDALDNIPPIPVPYGTIDDFHLECSDNNKNVILKIGTSDKEENNEE